MFTSLKFVSIKIWTIIIVYNMNWNLFNRDWKCLKLIIDNKSRPSNCLINFSHALFYTLLINNLILRMQYYTRKPVKSDWCLPIIYSGQSPTFEYYSRSYEPYFFFLVIPILRIKRKTNVQISFVIFDLLTFIEDKIENVLKNPIQFTESLLHQ